MNYTDGEHGKTNFMSPTSDFELDNFKRSTRIAFYMQLLTTTFLFTIVHEDSTSENRQIMVALASLALQSVKKLFQKGNLENKRMILTL